MIRQLIKRALLDDIKDSLRITRLARLSRAGNSETEWFIPCINVTEILCKMKMYMNLSETFYGLCCSFMRFFGSLVCESGRVNAAVVYTDWCIGVKYVNHRRLKIGAIKLVAMNNRVAAAWNCALAYGGFCYIFLSFYLTLQLLKKKPSNMPVLIPKALPLPAPNLYHKYLHVYFLCSRNKSRVSELWLLPSQFSLNPGIGWSHLACDNQAFCGKLHSVDCSFSFGNKISFLYIYLIMVWYNISWKFILILNGDLDRCAIQIVCARERAHKYWTNLNFLSGSNW